MSTGDVISVDPLELKFLFESNEQISSSLHLTNNNDNHVGYKKEVPPDMKCKDKFLRQSVIASPGTTAKNITPEIFSKDSGNAVEECKLRVVYLHATPSTSAIGQGTEEVFSPNALGGSRTYADSHENSSEVRPLISNLTDEKNASIEQINRMRQELDLLRRGSNKSQGSGAPLMFVDD